MATKLGKDDKKTDANRPGKGEGGARVSFDMKYFLAALGLAGIVFGSAIIGVYIAVNRIVKQTVVIDHPVKEIPDVPGPIFQIINDQVVNLSGGHFLRFGVAIQFAADDVLFKEDKSEGKHVSPVANFDAMIKDGILTVASKHTSQQLLDTAGKERFKDEIKATLNAEFKAMDSGREEADRKAHPLPKIFKIYFPSFVIS